MNPRAMDAIRSALASGEFAKAQRLWEEHVAAVRAAILAGSATPAALAELRELLDWARLVVNSFRAHARGQLAGLMVAEAYGPHTEPPARHVRTRC